MTENMKHCKYLLPVQYVIDGGATIMTAPQWACQLKESLYSEMDWGKCQQTPIDRPCWQYPSMTIGQWNDFVKQRLRELRGE